MMVLAIKKVAATANSNHRKGNTSATKHLKHITCCEHFQVCPYVPRKRPMTVSVHPWWEI